MPLRVAMPNSVMKPTSEATADGRRGRRCGHAADQRQRQVDQHQQRVACAEPNATTSSRKMPDHDHGA
jgi:hypothetical protein